MFLFVIYNNKFGDELIDLGGAKETIYGGEKANSRA